MLSVGGFVESAVRRWIDHIWLGSRDDAVVFEWLFTCIVAEMLIIASY